MLRRPVIVEVLNAKRQRGGSIVNVDNFSFNMKIPAFAKMNRGTSLRIFRNIFLRNIGTETCESKQIIKTTQAAGMTC